MKSTASLLLTALAFLAVACGGNNDKPVLGAQDQTFSADEAAQSDDNAIFAVKTFADDNGNVNNDMTQVAIVRGDFASEQEAQVAINAGANWQPINGFVQDDELRFVSSNEAASFDEFETELFTAARNGDRPRNRDRARDRRDRRDDRQARRDRRDRRDRHRFRHGRHRGHKDWRPFRHHRRWAHKRWTPRHSYFSYGPRRFRCPYNAIYFFGQCAVPVSYYYGGYKWRYRGGYGIHRPHHSAYSRVTVRFYF